VPVDTPRGLFWTADFTAFGAGATIVLKNSLANWTISAS
jgi:hypothetical protein